MKTMGLRVSIVMALGSPSILIVCYQTFNCILHRQSNRSNGRTPNNEMGVIPRIAIMPDFKDLSHHLPQEIGVIFLRKKKPLSCLRTEIRNGFLYWKARVLEFLQWHSVNNELWLKCTYVCVHAHECLEPLLYNQYYEKC